MSEHQVLTDKWITKSMQDLPCLRCNLVLIWSKLAFRNRVVSGDFSLFYIVCSVDVMSSCSCWSCARIVCVIVNVLRVLQCLYYVYVCSSCFWQTLMDLMEQVSMGQVVTADSVPPPIHIHSHAGLNSFFVLFVLLCVCFWVCFCCCCHCWQTMCPCTHPTAGSNGFVDLTSSDSEYFLLILRWPCAVDGTLKTKN